MRRRLHLRLCLRIQCASWSVVPSLSHYQTHLCPCPVFIIIPIVSSAPSTCYDSASSTIPFITSLHLALERRRILARRANRHRKSNQQQQQRGGGQPPPPPPPHFPHSNGDPHGNETHNDEMMEDAESGPRLMVLGPANAGKSTMIKNLVNLALGSGMGWAPAVVGLDPSNVSLVWLFLPSLAQTPSHIPPLTCLSSRWGFPQSPHLLPGSISLSTPTQALPSHHPSHFLGSPPTTSAATTLASDVPTMGWYIGTSELGGGTGTRTSFPLWRKIVASMQDAWEQRREKDDICKPGPPCPRRNSLPHCSPSGACTVTDYLDDGRAGDRSIIRAVY